ncbi:pilus assembly protein N-terminal domain-containing protein [Desulfogranum japonicum]|uniref:pilus assembly protein N-terminal domain-containing protein n=1 Tax=Desulfogranum japonicum TaxID=231447 RepID=UPI0004277A01|nr:pilus assembly protein N-terminal domain-containing protein [Desulfogranum japonicum]
MECNTSAGVRWLGALLLVMAVLLPSVQAQAEQVVTVYVNESKVVSLKERFSEYALGNDSVANCVVRRNDEYGAEVVLNGVAEGTTNLIFWNQGGQIFAKFDVKVKVRDLGQAAANVKQKLEGIQGIKVEVAGQKIIVSGKVLTTDDLKRVNLLLEGDEDVINTVTLGPAALKVMARIINDFAGGDGQVQVRTIGQNLVLVGTVYGKGSAQRIEDFAKVFHANVVNLIKEKEIDLDVGAGDMIQVHAHFMEVNTNAMEAMGFSWGPFGGLSAQTGVGETAENGVHNHSAFWQVDGFLSELLPHFENGRERNMGRQLKVSSVSVKSGQPAEFQSGGELGYPVISSMGAASLEFKKYGITLKVLPFAQGNNVTLKIHVKINLPTNLGSAGAGSVGSYVNFTNTEVDTTQYCRAGDSIAISGLLSQIDRKVFDADPGSSGALFELFRSKEFSQEKSDLVIFITPQILANARDANMEAKQRTMQLFDAYDPISR